METGRAKDIMKALADTSRLAIVNSLQDRPQYLEEVAERHGLASSTASFHLSKLEKAGLVSKHKQQYYTVFRLNEEIFGTTLREIISSKNGDSQMQDIRMKLYRRKVLDSFFKDGTLTQLPVQHKKRVIVLEELSALFEHGRPYREDEVTDIIKPVFADYCTVRREMVEEGMVERNGTTYIFKGEVETVGLPPKVNDNKRAVKMESAKKAAIRAYKQADRPMGVFQIKNKANGKVFVSSGRDLNGIMNSHAFQLRAGAHKNRALQKDWDQFGEGKFDISVLEVLKPKWNVMRDHTEDLKALEKNWVEKLKAEYNREK